MFAGVLLGVFLRKALPKHHFDVDSKEVIKLAAGMIAMQAALVLGLLVSSAKSSFDSMNDGLTQAGAKFILVDRALSRYGPESRDLREQLRHNLAFAIEQIWPKHPAGVGGVNAFEEATEWQKLGDKLLAPTPRNESQRQDKAQAVQIAGELAQLRWSLIEGMHTSIPIVLLGVLVFWFTVLFAMFGLLAPGNATLNTVLLVCALSVAGGVFLILEMSQPLTGILKVSSAPLENALNHLGQ